jgi:beta-N-acetylhexosaminidase
MTIGPVMVDLKGVELTDEDRRRLSHPLVGGVILFTRNYRSPAQLTELTQAIHEVKSPPLLIGVDHEGGRVQRFRDEFTRIPPMRELGRLWDREPRQARQLAREIGYILGAELRAHGVDFSFTPVLDIDFGESSVIGDRAFHRDPQAIGDLAHDLQQGLRDAGMETVGKHYPGHGYVRADSHKEVPVDERDLIDIELSDLMPFKQMIHYGMTAVMPAHVIYPKVDKKPAGFSKIWLQDILRGQLGFEGVIFSDDLSMEGASTEGGIVARARAALEAGCDMVLVCNNPPSADELLAGLEWTIQPASIARLIRMRGGPHPLSMTSLRQTPRYRHVIADIGAIAGAQSQLALGSDPTQPCV